MSDGFLGRWSRRKLEAKQDRPASPEPARREPLPPAPADDASAGQPPHAIDAAPAEPPAPELPPPTLLDVQALTAESDFSRFVAPQVDPAVKNAALKKLFADPRYNVMDGLDVYIDDYSQPNPLPAHAARQLAGALLGAFEPATARDDADAAPATGVAQSDLDPPAAPTDADPDLRLQQDDAAEGGGAGPGAA